ncbi:hypothetical protein CCUS01_12310 [Colletotrichum cuscutae]|uniref:Uncharacterized protein n=1 Tax=Colletotrichum cuscutae TaxID=1209917 RepID=A0AAI9TVC5_9PEZI|nr:hypothetical protein CCUS01_12310 [Colletotrichum cuscutae]
MTPPKTPWSLEDEALIGEWWKKGADAMVTQKAQYEKSIQLCVVVNWKGEEQTCWNPLDQHTFRHQTHGIISPMGTPANPRQALPVTRRTPSVLVASLWGNGRLTSVDNTTIDMRPRGLRTCSFGSSKAGNQGRDGRSLVSTLIRPGRLERWERMDGWRGINSSRDIQSFGRSFCMHVSLVSTLTGRRDDMMVRPNRGSPRRGLRDGKRWKRTEWESAPRILDHRYVPTREGALLTLTFDVGKDSIRGSETGEALIPSILRTCLSSRYLTQFLVGTQFLDRTNSAKWATENAVRFYLIDWVMWLH